MDRSYLERGLTALSRASKTDANHGHWGAAVLAAYYFAEENELSVGAAAAHRAQVDKLIGRFETYFEPLPAARPEPDLRAEIGLALSGNIDGLRAIGHNVIFSTLALRALRDEPALCTPPIVEGILDLVRSYDPEGPGSVFPGFTQREIDDVVAEPPKVPLSWDDPSALARHAVQTLLDVEIVYGGAHAGIVGHVLTHADALVELSRLGEGALARRGQPAYLAHAALTAKTFDPRPDKPPRSASNYSPLSETYWQQSLEGRSGWSYGHKFKYPYSFFRLARRIRDAAVTERGQESLRRLL